MFDANMKHLPKGLEFFAEVWDCEEDSVLYNEGIRVGDILLCTMLSIGSENPRIIVHLDHGNIRIRNLDTYDVDGMADTWLVYSGRKDLTNFIDFHCREKAARLLEDRGYESKDIETT